MVINTVVYSHDGILFTNEYEQKTTTATKWMNLGTILSEKSQTQRYILYDSIYIKYKKQGKTEL